MPEIMTYHELTRPAAPRTQSLRDPGDLCTSAVGSLLQIFRVFPGNPPQLSGTELPDPNLSLRVALEHRPPRNSHKQGFPSCCLHRSPCSFDLLCRRKGCPHSHSRFKVGMQYASEWTPGHAGHEPLRLMCQRGFFLAACDDPHMHACAGLHSYSGWPLCGAPGKYD